MPVAFWPVRSCIFVISSSILGACKWALQSYSPTIKALLPYLLTLCPSVKGKTKHIFRAAEFVRDLVTRQILVMKWIPGASNVADICTKAVALPVFRALMPLLCRLNDIS